MSKPYARGTEIYQDGKESRRAVSDKENSDQMIFPLSRQRLWQIKHIEQGLCIYCPKLATYGRLCADHAKKVLIRQRNLYRRKHGIPLEAPKWSRANGF